MDLEWGRLTGLIIFVSFCLILFASVYFLGERSRKKKFFKYFGFEPNKKKDDPRRQFEQKIIDQKIKEMCDKKSSLHREVTALSVLVAKKSKEGLFKETGKEYLRIADNRAWVMFELIDDMKHLAGYFTYTYKDEEPKKKTEVKTQPNNHQLAQT